MRKALILIALAAELLVCGAAVAQRPLKTPEQVLIFLGRHRQDTALVTFTATPDGSPDPADPALFLNADEPMPLASTIKVVVLAAYAREVVAGRIDPREEVPLSDWERFYLPRTDAGAHPAALAALGIPADGNGFVFDPTATVPLDFVVRAMIRRSDNAATDYLIQRLGRDALRETIEVAGLTGQDVPLPLLGLFLSWFNHEDGSLTERRFRHLQELQGSRYVALVDRFNAAYQDESWRQEEISWQVEGRYRHPFPVEMRTAGTFFPHGTARDYARILAGVVTGTFLSPEISAVMKPHLERDLLGTTDFQSIGFKGGSLDGVLTQAAWFIPKEGAFAGKPRIVVLFQRWIPLFDWALFTRFNGYVYFSMRLAQDRDFALLTRKVLARGR